MSHLDAVRSGLAGYFQSIQRRVHGLLQPLSTEQLWVRPYDYGNSIGHLLLHLTGNLNYYIGARIAGSGYVRHRDEEFSGPGKAKEQVLAGFDRTIEMVVETVGRQSDADWSASYSAVGTEMADRFSMILNCAAHADHHLGQITYLQRELLGRGGA
jgi:hypothetical protein